MPEVETVGPDPAGEGESLVRVSLALFLGSLLLRLVHLAWMATPVNSLLDPALLETDPLWIYTQAFRVLDEGWLPQEPFPHSPAYCYVAAAVFGTLGAGAYPVLAVVNAIFGSLIPPVVLLVARRFVGMDAAIGAAVLSALYGPLLAATAFHLGDVLGALLALLVLLQLLRFVEGPTWVGSALLGLGLGAAALGRPNALLLAGMVTPVILARPELGSLARRGGFLAVAGGITLAMIAPTTITASRGKGRLEVIVPTTEYNLIYANSLTSTGYGSAYPEPGTPLYPTFSPARLRHELRKASYLWRFFEFPCIDNYYLYAALSPLVDWNPLTWRLVGPFALLGIALALRERRRWAPVLWFVLWAWIPLNLTLVYGRLRLIMMPVLILLAAAGASWMVAQRRPSSRDPRHRIFAGLFLASVIFVNAQDPSTYHGTFYADYSLGNGRIARAGICLDRARESSATGRPDLARRLVDLARREAEGLHEIASPNYQVAALDILQAIARDFDHDSAREAELQTRRDRLLQEYLELTPSDHQGNRFTPPTYRFWPAALTSGRADLSWLERERARERERAAAAGAAKPELPR